MNNRGKTDWRKEKEQSPRKLWNYNKRANICIIGILKGEEKEGRVKMY